VGKIESSLSELYVIDEKFKGNIGA